MNLQAYLNIEQSKIENPIYRIFSIDRLFELFNLRKNTLVKPQLWDDPFENYLFRSKMKFPNGEEFIYSDRDFFYGQCWTLHEETDAMWRIYSPFKNAVKIKTNIKKLITSLYEEAPQPKHNTCFIGEVNYLSKEDIVTKIENGVPFNDITSLTGIEQTNYLLIKRLEFAHEAEIRLIFFKTANTKSDKIFQYKINPLDLIDEIVFDPRISNSIFEGYKQAILSLGFKKDITKSKLYNLPDFEVKLTS